MQGLSSTTRAILVSLLALLLFDLMGLIVKYLSPRYTAAELSVYRNLFGMVPSAIVLWTSKDWHARGRPIRIRQWWLGVSRGLAVSLAQLMFYMSLGILAFATAATISYSNAIFVTALAVPLLGEKVGLVRWSAVLVGFAGVILIMRPGGDTFSYAALLPLGAAVLYAYAAASARLVDRDVPSPLLNLYTQSTALVFALVFVVFWGGFNVIQSWGDMAWIAAMGTCGGLAVLALIYAYRMTEPANLAPFTYLGIPLAFFLGWVFYGEAPWADLFPGAFLLVAAGLLIVWRERQLARK